MRLRPWRRRRPRPAPPERLDPERPPLPTGYGVGTETYLLDKVSRGEMTATEFVKLSRIKGEELKARRGHAVGDPWGRSPSL